ncbi:MAG: hypothetical protein ABJB40_13525 [Acidobacteriota bacterium]
MIGLNISSFNENMERDDIWQESIPPEVTSAVAEPVEEPFRPEGLVPRPDLFDLARSISSRAYSRRRIRRSSAII